MGKKRIKNMSALSFYDDMPKKNVIGRCTCSCHASGAKHCIACCNKCPHCGENIILAIYDSHVEECAQSAK